MRWWWATASQSSFWVGMRVVVVGLGRDVVIRRLRCRRQGATTVDSFEEPMTITRAITSPTTSSTAIAAAIHSQRGDLGVAAGRRRFRWAGSRHRAARTAAAAGWDWSSATRSPGPCSPGPGRAVAWLLVVLARVGRINVRRISVARHLRRIGPLRSSRIVHTHLMTCRLPSPRHCVVAGPRPGCLSARGGGEQRYRIIDAACGAAGGKLGWRERGGTGDVRASLSPDATAFAISSTTAVTAGRPAFPAGPAGQFVA